MLLLILWLLLGPTSLSSEGTEYVHLEWKDYGFYLRVWHLGYHGESVDNENYSMAWG
jgi:hypothetical protein